MEIYLGLRCVPYMRLELRLAFHKRCPHCKANNDLTKFLEESIDWESLGLQTIPLCISCGKPLWKTKRGYILYLHNVIQKES